MSTAAQKALIDGTSYCRNSACGKEGIYEELSMTPAKYARQLQRQEQERVAAIAQQVKDTANQIARLQQQQIAKGVDIDYWDLRRVDPACCEITMTAAQAKSYNAEQHRLFCAETPAWFASPENLSVMEGYLERQGSAGIVSKAMLTAAFRRLDSYGLLEHRPAPEPARQPQQQPQATFTERAPAQPKRRESEEGYDLRTGERRKYTPYEIDRMSADEFKRVFRLYGERAPRFPTHAAF